MEKLCKYCSQPFIPKRTDAEYCSQSCRQLAYVLRKSSTNGNDGLNIDGLSVNKEQSENYYPSIMEPERQDETSIKGSNADYPSSNEEGEPSTIQVKNNYPSIMELEQQDETSTKGANDDYPSTSEEGEPSTKEVKSNYPSIDGADKPVKQLSEAEQPSIIQQLAKKMMAKKPSITQANVNQTSTNTDSKPSIKRENASLNVQEPSKLLTVKGSPVNQNTDPQWKIMESAFIIEIADVYNSFRWTNIQFALQECRDFCSGWVNVRYRCLLECLLTFSEMKQVLPDDVKEVCNAFTLLVNSTYFESLPDAYPFTDEICELKNRLKHFCSSLETDEPVRLRLTRYDKMNVLLSRYELAKHVPRRTFNELDFEE